MNLDGIELDTLAEEWPLVPENQRPKPLYHMGQFPEKANKAFERKGWQLVDCRLMENETDGEKAAWVKAVLEGLSVGSIEYTDQIAKTIALLSQVLGLGKGTKVEGNAVKILPGSALADVLDFGKNPSNLSGQNVVDQVWRKKNRPGRPRGRNAKKVNNG